MVSDQVIAAMTHGFVSPGGVCSLGEWTRGGEAKGGSPSRRSHYADPVLTVLIIIPMNGIETEFSALKGTRGACLGQFTVTRIGGLRCGTSGQQQCGSRQQAVRCLSNKQRAQSGHAPAYTCKCDCVTARDLNEPKVRRRLVRWQHVNATCKCEWPGSHRALWRRRASDSHLGAKRGLGSSKMPAIRWTR